MRKILYNIQSNSYLVLFSFFLIILSGCVSAKQIEGKMHELKSSKPKVRMAAAKSLVGYGSKSVPYLLESLNSENPDIRETSAWALGQLKAENAIAPLVYRLTDTDDRVRKNAEEALKNFDPDEVSDVLLQRLSSLDPNERTEGARMLGVIRSPKAIQPLIELLTEKDDRVRHTIKNSLKNYGNEVIPYLIKGLISNKPTISEESSSVLVSIGRPSVPFLIEELENPNIEVQLKAIKVLEDIRETDALEPLICKFESEKPEIRLRAMIAISKFGGKALKILETEAKSSNSRVRSTTAQTLGIIARTECIPLLSKLSTDKESSVRKEAVISLGKIAGRESSEVLLNAMVDPYWEVRKSAADVISGTGWTPSDNTQKAMFLVAAQDWQGASDIGGDAIQFLKNPLREQQEWLRKSAITSLIKIGTASIEPLLECLNDKSVELRLSAIEALGKIENSKVKENLSELLTDKNPEIRRKALQALANPANIDIVPKIAKLLIEDKDKLVRKNAVETLGIIGGSLSEEVLAKAIKDEDWIVRRNAAESLGLISSDSSVKILVAALEDKEELVRKTAVEILQKRGWNPQNDSKKTLQLASMKKWREIPPIGKNAVQMLTGLIKDKNPQNRSDIAFVLGELRDESSIPVLAKLILEDNSAHVKKVASEAIAKFAKKAEKELMKVLDDAKDPLTVKCVVEALACIPDAHEDTVEELIDLLNDSELALIRKSAATALGSIGNKRVVKYLIKALESDREKKPVKIEACRAIAKIKDPACLKKLQELIHGTNDTELKAELARAIDEIKEWQKP